MFMVPGHVPATIFGAYRSMIPADAEASSASTAPTLPTGHSAKAGLAAFHISARGAHARRVSPNPPSSTGRGTPGQPPSMNCLYALRAASEVVTSPSACSTGCVVSAWRLNGSKISSVWRALPQGCPETSPNPGLPLLPGVGCRPPRRQRQIRALQAGLHRVSFRSSFFPSWLIRRASLSAVQPAMQD